MEYITNNENRYPKSLGRIGFNSFLKNNIQFKNEIDKRTPLKSKINLVDINHQPLNSKNENSLKFPLLKSIYNKTKFHNFFSNEKYNENALIDSQEDFMHINENEIYINNNVNNYYFDLNKPIINEPILNHINPFLPNKNKNYVLGGHFDDEGKKEYDYYFNFQY